MPKKIPNNRISYVRRRKDKLLVAAGVAKHGTSISFDLSKHGDWKEFKRYDPVFGIYKDVDFYCTPYFDDGYINCKIDSNTYWEIKAYVLAFYVGEFTKIRRDKVHAHMKDTMKLNDKNRRD